MSRRYIVDLAGQPGPATYEVEADGEAFLVRREGEEEWRRVRLDGAGDADHGVYLLTINDRPREIFLAGDRDGITATIGRHTFQCEVETWRPAGKRSRAAAAKVGGAHSIAAPMTGSVVEVQCADGDEVETNAVLLVIESMKMNNEIRAPARGTVTSVRVAAGDRITAGETLVELELEPEPEGD